MTIRPSEVISDAFSDHITCALDMKIAIGSPDKLTDSDLEDIGDSGKGGRGGWWGGGGGGGGGVWFNLNCYSSTPPPPPPPK